MRLDKFLKVSRILKRRTAANAACGGGKVTVNGRTGKPGAQLKEGDVVEVGFGSGLLKFRVLSLNEKTDKDKASSMYEVIND